MAIEMQGCERCSKEFPLEQMTMQEDCWICEGCYADFKKHFDACEHQWEPHINSYGEPSQYCPKCIGLVRDDDLGLLKS